MGEDRLLLVEDDDATREVLTVLLEADGWAVRGAESGEAALDALRGPETGPRVVLCDLHLPGLQAGALATALRPLAPKALLLAMSASPADADALSGYDGLLLKPFGPADLRAAVAERKARDVAGPSSPTETGEDRNDLPVVATETFLKLEQQMGTRVKDLYAFALADAGDRLARMEQSMKQGDVAAYQKEAHQLKGSAGMIGAERLAALASSAEVAGAAALDGSPDEKLRRLHLACNEIRLMLETLFPM